VTAVITTHKAPPTAILDAHFVEEQTGDNLFGPSDFQAFYFVELAPRHVSQWTQLLTPLGTAAEYAAPAQPRDCWTHLYFHFYNEDALRVTAPS
jgi:hypothetical protein